MSRGGFPSGAARRRHCLTQVPVISALDTLSAAYAETGHFDRAMETVHRALALAQTQGDAGAIARLKAHRAKYEALKPLRDPEDQGTL